MYKAGLIGVTGYTGMELARILATHPQIELTHATSRQESGKKIEDLYPFLRSYKIGSVCISDYDAQELAKECDIIFLAVPHGTAMQSAGEIFSIAKTLNKTIKIIDLSADFRIKNPETYEAWYQIKHTEQDLLTRAVYGLFDIYADSIKNADLIANPGCYPTASILGLYPALKNALIQNDIVIDAKSGTSGAGRKAQASSLFCEVYDNFRPYSIGGKHRHTPEIEQELSAIAKKEIFVSFNPHLLPIERGILNTIYAPLAKAISAEKIHALYAGEYENSPFVRVLPSGQLPETRNVRGSLFCDIAISVDTRTNKLIIASAIDNLARGASMQAVANANLCLGLPLATGINNAPLCP
ncbi:N-acetyl-gamma-glutamyl-phosphate reductase [Taurinivorans muris]|uniref:N-acetyl-gamma-glutamyl-phosphate reductase n=1 Tax=Taurinivorans muris TaxID=2787751 RepID=A0ABY5Y4P1_9BACT|nr:N-acetyl-gamma-glutamyl-phosphate reductase [Desulfovibrionaceae bacterium LT0009]